MKRNEMIEVLEYYHNVEDIIHIDTLDGKFYNGVVISLKKDIIILKDRKLGDVAIHIDNVSNIEKFKEVGE